MTKAGRELDAEVAEKVFGHAVKWQRFGGLIHAEYSYVIPLYSTDIEAAWEVVKRFTERGEAFVISGCEDSWTSTFTQGATEKGATAPHAICLAALKAVVPILEKPAVSVLGEPQG